ncbi:transcription elongation factor GreA [Abditibacteriota bacterium]|nr:transcription elongation factor GreA [Abditibacteriota bacterium]
MAGFQAQFTREGFERLKTELEQLKLDRIALREEVKEARELGDLKENAGYHAARQALGILEGRISGLETRLEDAVIVENGSFEDVQLGIPVKIKNLTNGNERVYTIVGSEEMEFTEGGASELSPIGQALLGKKVGDVVNINPQVQFEILSIGSEE